MTKKEYLRQLEEEIVLIDEDIADDIIEHYRFRFEDGKKYEGKSTDEIIEELGTPKELAKRIYASYDIREDLWQSAREEEVQPKHAIPVILFDILIGTWLIPLLIFITLTGFASFVTFPFVIAAIPGLIIRDALLVVLLAIGTYSILLLLVLGLTEVGIVIIKNILIWNLKVLSPRNKTTARLIKKFSLFQWMREMRMGRNIFINIGMIGITIISMSFILLSNFNDSDVFSIFASDAELEKNVVRDLATEIENDVPYFIDIDLGDVDVKIVENLGTNIEVDHKYTLEDGLDVTVNLEDKIIYIRTFQELVNDGFFSEYSGSMVISIPAELIVEGLMLRTDEGDITMLDYEVENMEVSNELGDIYLYSMEADTAEVISEEGSITVIDGFYKSLSIASTTSYITVSDTNNMLKDGDIIKITTFEGTVDLHNTYYKTIEVSTNSAPIYINNENDIYVVEQMLVNSPEGEIIINATYTE